MSETAQTKQSSRFVEMEEVGQAQRELCKRFGVEPFATPGGLKVGIALNVRDGIQPLNGLRCDPDGEASGWYIWAGEALSDDPKFFVPLHVSHLATWCPAILPYLTLPSGWRFLIAPGQEDVWLDEALLGQSK